ncbi:hypothetical protein RclHR1_03200009 [Rhizophagus clarus]|uniref:Uncharacterized protein n=1 Tax=Rhizophagus clarus TaxID=94130 RepID=A0A2Z6RMJ2_9GLOM|nr:hypothetical protein RclHR1_03200009 [Rhizophagus clarus]
MRLKQAAKDAMQQRGFDLDYWDNVKDLNILTYLYHCKSKARTKLDKSKVYKNYTNALECIKSNYETGSNQYNKVVDALEAYHDDVESSMVKRFWERYNDNDVDVDVGDNNDDDNDATTSIHSMQQEKCLNVDFNRHSKLKNYCMRLRELLNQNSEQLSQQGRHAYNMLEWNVVDYGIFSKIIFPDKIPELPDISLPCLNLKNTLVTLRRKDQRFDPLIRIMQSLLEKNKISDNSEWFGNLYKWSYQLYTSIKYHDIDITTADDRGYLISDFAAVVIDQDEGQYPSFLAEFASENTDTHKDKIVVVSEAAYELNCILETVENLDEWEVNKISFHAATVGGAIISFNTITPIFNEECSALIYVYRNEHTFNLRKSNSNMEMSNTVSNSQGALPNLPSTPEKSRVNKGTYTPPSQQINYIFQNLD